MIGIKYRTQTGVEGVWHVHEFNCADTDDAAKAFLFHWHPQYTYLGREGHDYDAPIDRALDSEPEDVIAPLLPIVDTGTDDAPAVAESPTTPDAFAGGASGGAGGGASFDTQTDGGSYPAESNDSGGGDSFSDSGSDSGSGDSGGGSEGGGSE